MICVIVCAAVSLPEIQLDDIQHGSFHKTSCFQPILFPHMHNRLLSVIGQVFTQVNYESKFYLYA